jgi:ADP-ribose pyrophosphatase YjhB (NUDIX family)
MERFSLHPSALMILSQGDEVFLMRRHNTSYGEGMYTVPSGVLDGNETAKEAAIRETAEEAGVTLEPEEVSLVHTLHRRKPDGEEWIDLFFQAQKWDQEPHINEPHRFDNSGWYSLNSLPENTLDFVRHALKKIEEGEIYSDFGFENS